MISARFLAILWVIFSTIYPIALHAKDQSLPPLPEDTKKFIEEARMRVEETGQAEKSLFSVDCKDWKSADPKNVEAKIEVKDVLYIKNQDSITLIDYKNQAQLNLNKNEYTFLKVNDNGVTGVLGKSPVYKDLKSEKNPGQLEGILLALSLVAKEKSTEWSLNFDKSEPFLFRIINEKNNPILKDYYAILCSKAQWCMVFKDKKPEDLLRSSPVYSALKGKNYFSKDTTVKFVKICEYVQRLEFLKSYQSYYSDFNKACGFTNDMTYIPKLIQTLKSSCDKIRKDLLPMVEKY